MDAYLIAVAIVLVWILLFHIRNKFDAKYYHVSLVPTNIPLSHPTPIYFRAKPNQVYYWDFQKNPVNVQSNLSTNKRINIVHDKHRKIHQIITMDLTKTSHDDLLVWRDDGIFWMKNLHTNGYEPIRLCGVPSKAAYGPYQLVVTEIKEWAPTDTIQYQSYRDGPVHVKTVGFHQKLPLIFQNLKKYETVYGRDDNYLIRMHLDLDGKYICRYNMVADNQFDQAIAGGILCAHPDLNKSDFVDVIVEAPAARNELSLPSHDNLMDNILADKKYHNYNFHNKNLAPGRYWLKRPLFVGHNWVGLRLPSSSDYYHCKIEIMLSNGRRIVKANESATMGFTLPESTTIRFISVETLRGDKERLQSVQNGIIYTLQNSVGANVSPDIGTVW